jgi:flagellar biosynthetic protein FliR
MLDDLLPFIPTFVLVFFRLAGMMLFAPLFGSSRIPRRVRALLVAVLAMSVTGNLGRAAQMPETTWGLAAAIGGEMVFGLAMGMVLSLVFIAVQWAGELIGQQMGFNLSEVFDPQFGSQGSLIGDLYFMLTLVVFLTVGGHHAMLEGVRASFDHLPLLSAGLDAKLFDLLAGLLGTATSLAIRLAAPMLVTMLIVDLTLGLIGKAVPQMNVMSAGLSLRAAVGMLIVILGLGLTTSVIRDSVLDSMRTVSAAWVTPPER